MLASGGDDRVNGGGGDDFLSGGAGDDRLSGFRGDDHLGGGTGDDVLSGGRGDDVLRGGTGSHTLTGGSGATDFGAGRAVDAIEDYGAGDRIVDLSGDLRVVAAGRIALFRDGGTLIENRKTGDVVFVGDASSRGSDIERTDVPPTPGAHDDGRTRTEVISVFLETSPGRRWSTPPTSTSASTASTNWR